MSLVVLWSTNEIESELKCWSQVAKDVRRFFLHAVADEHVLEVIPRKKTILSENLIRMQRVHDELRTYR